LDALLPRDQIFEEEESAPLNFVRKEKPVVKLQKLNDEMEDDDAQKTKEDNATSKKKEVDVSWELIDNPYLRPLRPHRKKASRKSIANS